MTNRQWILAARPKGMPNRDDFTLREQPVPAIGANEFLVRTLYLSCDPAQRAWMSRDTYVPAIPIGDVVRAGATGQVVASNHPGFRPGDIVPARDNFRRGKALRFEGVVQRRRHEVG